jgi:hypothetical protein
MDDLSRHGLEECTGYVGFNVEHTGMWGQLRGAKEAANSPPGDLKEVEFTSCKRFVRTDHTDCTARLNQARRARNHHNHHVDA